MRSVRAYREGTALLARTIAAFTLALGLFGVAPATALGDEIADSETTVEAMGETRDDDATVDSPVDGALSTDEVAPAADGYVQEAEPQATEPVQAQDPIGESSPQVDGFDGENGTVTEPTNDAPAPETDDEDGPDEIILPQGDAEPQLSVDETPATTTGSTTTMTAQATSTKKSKRRPLVDGTFVIKSSLAKQLVLAARGKTPKAWANVRLAKYTGAKNQKWVVSYNSKSRSYRLYVYGSSRKLALGISKTGKKINVCVVPVDGIRSPKTILWTFVNAGSGSHQLVNKAYKKRCLDVAGSKAKSGTNVALVKKKATLDANQRFESFNTNPLVSAGSTKLEGSYNALLDANKALAVDVKGSGNNDLVLRDAGSGLAQNLYLKRDAKGFYTAWVIGSGKVLDIKSSRLLPGFAVRQATNTGKANQKWAIVATKNADGSYTATLQNKKTGLFLGSGKSAAGTTVTGVSGTDPTQLVKFRLTACELLEAGIYEIKPASNGKVSLYVSKGLSDNNANGKMILYTDKDLGAQRFELVDAAGKNTFRVRTAASGGWLTWNGGNSVVQKGRGSDAATAANTWKVSFNEGTFSLVNVGSGLALDTAGGANKSNTTMVLQSKGSGSSQRFLLQPSTLHGGKYVSFVAFSGRQVKAGTSNNAAVKVSTPTTKNLSQVFFVEQDGRYVRLRDYNGRYLTATGREESSALTTSKANGSDRQLWKIGIGDGGTIKITGVESGLALKYKSSAAVIGDDGTYESMWTVMDRTVDAMKERIAQVAIHFAEDNKHGYSQDNRGLGGPEVITVQDGTKVTISAADVDCSELVRQCVNSVLGYNKIEFMWTGTQNDILLANGFIRMAFSASAVERGDVLWCYGHTGVALGNGKQSDAHGDEYGGLSGPNRGDQTGHEVEVRDLRTGVWTYIYRYVG